MPRIKDGFRGERAIVLPRMIVEEMEKDALLSTLYITDMGYYPHASNHYRERKEPLGQYVLIYCVDGEGLCRVGELTHKMRGHQYMILPADKPHAYQADGLNPWTIYWVHFKGKLAEKYVSAETRPVSIVPGEHSRIDRRIELFEELFSTLKLGFTHDNLCYACAVLHYFLATFNYCSSYRNAVSTQSEDSIRSIIHYMEENIGRKLSIAEMAEYAGYSTSYFSTLFSEVMEQAPMAYFNQLKMQRACELLDFTDMRINQICYKVGIDDPYYFSRLFRQTMGISPKEYRRINQKGGSPMKEQ